MTTITTTGPVAPKAVAQVAAAAAKAAPAAAKVASDSLTLATKAAALVAPLATEATKKALHKGQVLGGLMTMAGLGAVGGAIFAVFMIPWAAYAALMVGGGALVVAGMRKTFIDGVKLGEIILAERAAAKLNGVK